MRIVVALGGNALLRRGEPMTDSAQRENVRHAAVSLAALIALGHHLTITHGNGPQVGLLALQTAAGSPKDAFPFDVLVAETEGMIGYLIEQELANLLPADARIATVLTQVSVDASDPAFGHPTKPIGPSYDTDTALRLEAERGWLFAPDNGRMRRVVASPVPLTILEMAVITLLVEAGVTVICAGGGGIPVTLGSDGRRIGIEAVIDKDRASGLVAVGVAADVLLLLTDVDAVYLDFGKPSARAIASAGAETLLAGEFPVGSMGPKIEAATAFVKTTGRAAAIGRLEDAVSILEGLAGTTIREGSHPIMIRSVMTAPPNSQ
jgi:carbamate kinase